jgi:hypothetical protein
MPISDSQLRAQKLGSPAPDQQDHGRIKEVLSVTIEVPQGLYQTLKIGLQGATTVSEFHDGLSRILVTVDGRDVQLSENFSEEKHLRVELRVVHDA